MRRLFQLCLAGLALFVAFSARADSAKTTLTIRGMTCGGCVAAVKLQLKKTPGVTAYEVSLEKGEAEVTYDPGKTDPKKITDSVSTTGFAASIKEADETRGGSKNLEQTVRDDRLSL